MSRTSYFQNIARSPATMPALQPARSIAPRPEAPFSLDVPSEPASPMSVIHPSSSQPVVERPGIAHLQQQTQAPGIEIVTSDKGYSANTVPPDPDSFATAQSTTVPLVPNSMQQPLETEVTLSLPQTRMSNVGTALVRPRGHGRDKAVPTLASPVNQDAGSTAKQEPATAHKSSLASPPSPPSHQDHAMRQHPREEVREGPKLVPTAALRPRPVPLQPRLEERAERFQARTAEKQQKATLSIGSIDVYIVQPPPVPVVPAPPKAAEVKSTSRARPAGALSRELLSSIGLRQG